MKRGAFHRDISFLGLASLKICNAGADEARRIPSALGTYRYYTQGSLPLQ